MLRPLLRKEMSKTLVVSDNDFLNLLYVMNLEVYLATTTTLVTTVQEAVEIVKNKPFDLIFHIMFVVLQQLQFLYQLLF